VNKTVSASVHPGMTYIFPNLTLKANNKNVYAQEKQVIVTILTPGNLYSSFMGIKNKKPPKTNSPLPPPYPGVPRVISKIRYDKAHANNPMLTNVKLKRYLRSLLLWIINRLTSNISNGTKTTVNCPNTQHFLPVCLSGPVAPFEAVKRSVTNEWALVNKKNNNT